MDYIAWAHDLLAQNIDSLDGNFDNHTLAPVNENVSRSKSIWTSNYSLSLKWKNGRTPGLFI